MHSADRQPMQLPLPPQLFARPTWWPLLATMPCSTTKL